jgi:hypothetical protein
MKYLFPLLLLIPFPAQAITWEEFWRPLPYRQEYYHVPMCTRFVYREQYVPGDQWNPGYVRRWTDRVRVPCSQLY